VTTESVDIEDLVDDFITLYTGGQDTSMSLLTFALVLTLLHPNVLEK
jgi:cytochrome P450